MKLSTNGLEFIKGFEAFRSTPYLCTGGYWTVGYGHALRKGESKEEVTRDRALEILSKDVRVAESAVSRLVKVALSQNQIDAIISFTFNLGGGSFQSSTLRQKLNRGEFEDVPSELMRWVRSGGKITKGLIRRRLAEATMFMG